MMKYEKKIQEREQLYAAPFLYGGTREAGSFI